MASNVPSRKTIRQALAAAMTTGLVGAGKAAKKLYRYKPSQFGAETTHIIVLTAASSDRSKQAQPVRANSVIGFEIWTFVLYSAEGWTEENSEDKLDDMEKEIIDWLLDNADNNANWDGITIEPTEIDIVSVGGKTYRQEVIPIQVQVFSE
jgi:hypothetical protein